MSPSTPPRPSRHPLQVLREALERYFLGTDPAFLTALAPLCLLSCVLFTRNPFHTNFILDERTALLGNEFVRSVADPLSPIQWGDAFRRDFWGNLPEATIGSYRPVPNLIWRALWLLGAREHSPFVHHWLNVVLHGVNAALLTIATFRVTRERGTAWRAGFIFVSSAVLTEAVTGVVGLADVLAAMGCLLALMALALPLGAIPIAVFAATLFALLSKESTVALVLLIPCAAFALTRLLHPESPRRLASTLVAALGSLTALVVYVEARRRLFPIPVPANLSDVGLASDGTVTRSFHQLLRWWAQPGFVHSPIDNPFLVATVPYRVAGALRVCARGFVQLILPVTLSGDYSAPAELVPASLLDPESIAGACLLAGSFVAGAVLIVRGVRPLVGLCLLWAALSYFPVSNIAVLLPTVRAERFWYLPALATSVLFAMVIHQLLVAARAWSEAVLAGTVLSLCAAVGFQCVAARRHANDYRDELTFWEATRRASPRSAKAHLNYAVVAGKNGDIDARVAENRVAVDLAPDWAAANVNLGYVLCVLHRREEAWRYFARGFELADQDRDLVAMGLQCMWEEGALAPEAPARGQLAALAEQHGNTWLWYLATDILARGATHGGVDPRYRFGVAK